MSHIGVACLVALAGVLMGGCSTIAELSSSWNNNEIVIDGLATEWKSHFFYLKDSQIFLGIQNDSDFLYVCLMSSEGQFRRQMVGLGLTVWLEPEDGKKLGIHYPIGLPGHGTPASFNREDTRSPEESEAVVEQSLETLELLGPGKEDHQLFSALEVPGISVRVGSSKGSGVYELKIPLRASSEHPYTVGVGAGSTVKLGIEIGKFEPKSRQGERRGGGMRGGGWGKRGGGSPGGGVREGGGSGRARARGDRPEPLSFWAKVQLSVLPTQ